jgi:hypothetical protein
LWRCASSRNFTASNFDIKTIVPPPASAGKKLTSVVFEYSGVEQIVTAFVSYPEPAARLTCAQRMRCGCTIPFGVPVVPDE